MKKSQLRQIIKEAYGSLKEGEDYFDHYKDDLIFTVANLDVARDLYKKAYKYGFVSDHYFDNDIRYGNTTGSDIIVFPASVNDLPNSAGKLIKIIGKEPITIEGWEDIVTESVNEMHDRQLPDVEQWEDDKKTTMKRSELKEFIKEAYLKSLREEDDEGIDDVEDDFEAEPAVAQDGESKNQESAPRKRINFENRELEMLVDVNKNATKKGIKIQFLSDDELSKEERAKLVSSLQTYLDEGLAKFVKGAKLNVDSDQDVPNKDKTVGFTIKIGDVFGLVSKVFANRGDDEEEAGGEEDFEAETEEAPEEELQELRKHIRGFLKESFRDENLKSSEYVPYHFDDEEGKALWYKFADVYDNGSIFKPGDVEYSRVANISDVLQTTGMTMDELEYFSQYGDESWSVNIDKDMNIITVYTD